MTTDVETKFENENNRARNVAIRFIESVMQPLSRLVMRFGASAPDVCGTARHSFVHGFFTTPDFWRGDTPTAQQCAVKTALPRHEISKLLEQASPHESLLPARQNRSARVIEGWLNDPEFQQDGQPLLLPLRSSEPPSFNRLALRYGGNIRPNTILDDLLQAKCVEVRDDKVVLINSTYGLEFFDQDKLDVAAYMVNRLIDTSDHNITHTKLIERHLQRYWRQRFIPQEKAAEVRAYITVQAIEAGRRIDHHLSQLSHAEPQAGVEYSDIGIGMYLFEDQDTAVPGNASDDANNAND